MLEKGYRRCWSKGMEEQSGTAQALGQLQQDLPLPLLMSNVVASALHP